MAETGEGQRRRPGDPVVRVTGGHDQAGTAGVTSCMTSCVESARTSHTRSIAASPLA
ncbi:hypothetical protein KAURM247S_05825 [Kitasatospora aureofaciens]